jgi:lambda family phage portal protein
MKLTSWLKKAIGLSSKTDIHKRRFEAAQFNRLTRSWQLSAQSINTELRGDLDALRRRSRELAKNEPMAAKFLSLVVSNVVGSNGFRLQSRIIEGDTPDKRANDAVEAAYAKWCEAGICEVSGRMTMADLERAIIRSVARDGEALVRELPGFKNGFGYALQLLDIERLDTSFNRERSPGVTAVIMGVEIDEYGKPLAYHLASAQHGRDPTGKKLQRIPAEQIIHLFMTDDPEQVRGIPWMHASMMRMHHLKGYEEAAIVAARVGASKMGFFIEGENATTDLTTAVADGEDPTTGIPFTEASAGEFGALPAGWDFKSFNPDYPHDQFPEFVKSAKRDIGSGFEVSYHALANDLEGVNYSSIRQGTLEERDSWMLDQNWLKGMFHERVYRHWLDNALLSGAILLPNGSPLPASKYAKFLPHEFIGRRWAWVDPLKDIQTAVISIDNALDSPYSIAAQQGRDIEDVIEDIARFNALLKSKNITKAAPAAPAQNKPEEDDDK